jgi:hypothetical protein
MKIKFNKKGVFELKIHGDNGLVFSKNDDGTISIKMPFFYNKTQGEFQNPRLENHILVIGGTEEQFKEQIKKRME